MSARWLPALALTLAAAMGCGGSAVEHERVTRHVRYWEKWTGFEGEAMDAIVADFNAKERARSDKDPPYVPIEVEKVTISNLDQKLLIAIAGGTPPDLAGNSSFYVAAYADNGALTDLGPMLEKAHLDRSVYVDHYRELGEYRGHTFALPIAASSVALLSNKQLFREAGLDPEKPPLTIEELDAFSEKLTKWEVTLPSGEKKIETGYLPGVPPANKRLIQAGFLPGAFWPYGWGNFFGGHLLTSSDHVTTADPANVRAYQWVASISQRLGVDAIKRFRSGFGSFSSPQNAFLSGKVAMVLQGVWMHNFIEKYAPGLEWSAAPFPYPSGHPELAFTTHADADVLVIPTGSPHPAEAFEFMSYLSTRPVLEKLCLLQQKLTPLKSVSDDFFRAHPNPYLRLFRELGTGPNAFAIPATAVWKQYEREMVNALDLIQNLTQTPAATLMDVQSKMQVALDRHHRVLAQREPK